MDLPLRKISETVRSITLGWTAIPCEGYQFYHDDKRVSHTWNALQKQITFSKGGGLDTYKVVALGVKATGLYPPLVSPDSEKYGTEQFSSGPYNK